MQADLEAHVPLHLVPLYSVVAKPPFRTGAVAGHPGACMHIVYAIF